jgi:hypothetical protein
MLRFKFKPLRVLIALSFAFFPTLASASPALGNTCLQPHQVAQLATPQPNEDGSPNVQTIQTCGGDDVSYQIPLSGPVTFDGVSFTSLFVTTNSVIAFGQPDGTFHDFPMTPSISLFSQDWVAYPTVRADEAFTISHSHVGFQVTLKVRPYSNQGTPTVSTIVFTASYNEDRTLNISYYADNVDQYNTRTGVRLNDGTVVPFEQAGIVQEEEIPVAPGEPEPEPTLFISAPENLQATLEGNTISLTWDAPTDNNTPIERYAIFWSYDNFETGFAISSTTTSATITDVPDDVTVSIKVRADNDSEVVFSDFSQPVVVIVPPAPIPTNPAPSEPETDPSPTDPETENPSEDSSNPLPSPSPEEPVVQEPVEQPTETPTEPAPSPEELQPTPLPTPTPSEPEPVAPVVPPTTPVAPEPETSQEPQPEPAPQPQPQETTQPVPPATEPVELSPESPSEKTITSAKDLPEVISPSQLMQIDLTQVVGTDLTVAQAQALIDAALAVFETAEQGSLEYQQALDALFLAAQQDDIVLDEALAAIPLLGDALSSAVELINFLGNAGSDMSPEVRATAEKAVVAAVIVVQIALSAVSMAGIATTVNLRSGA